MSSVYKVRGSIHDQILSEGAAEVVSEASAEITTVAQNIDSVVTVANNIPGDLATLPEAVASANADATRAETAAASAVGIDTSAQASALTAQTAATAAAGSVAEVASLTAQASQSADGAVEHADDAGQAAALAERWANEAPGVEVTLGRYGAPHFLAIQESLLATAPNLQFRTFGDHAGEAGSDGATQEFNNLAADCGRGIAVNRLANRPSRLKLLAGVYTGPPAEGADLAMVPTVVSNIGLSDCTIEGPTAGSIVLEPSIITTGSDTAENNVVGTPATTRTVTVDIPAGTNQRFIAIQGISYHAGTGVPGLTCSAPGSAVTQRDQVGNGTHSGSTPIQATLWTGTIPDGASLPGTQFVFTVPLGWCACWQYVLVVQNAAGVEDYDLALRAGAAMSENFTGLSPAIAESMAVVVAMHQGAAAHPITLAPGTVLAQGKTPGGRSLKDFSYAVAVQSDRPASPLSFVGSSAYASPAVIGGVAFTPVTGTVSGGALLWKGTTPAVLAPGNMAVVWALSDGLRYQLDMVET